MSTDFLLLAVIASITVLALMTTINTRGKWRFTISAMMSACLLGGTVWLFTLQYSAVDADDAQGGRRRLSLKDLMPPNQNKAQQLYALLEEAGDLASELERVKLYNPSRTHEQLIARATTVEEKFETLLSEVNEAKLVIDKYPETAKLVTDAMEELKGACHLFKSYYYAESTDSEAATERLMKKRAHSADSMLGKAVKAVGENEKAINAKR